jgi:hypothetical protein
LNVPFSADYADLMAGEYMTGNPPDGIPDPVCMHCGKTSWKRTEVVFTGDTESYQGFELWSYCEDCETDTFHRINKYKGQK